MTRVRGVECAREQRTARRRQEVVDPGRLHRSQLDSGLGGRAEGQVRLERDDVTGRRGRRGRPLAHPAGGHRAVAGGRSDQSCRSGPRRSWTAQPRRHQRVGVAAAQRAGATRATSSGPSASNRSIHTMHAKRRTRRAPLPVPHWVREQRSSTGSNVAGRGPAGDHWRGIGGSRGRRNDENGRDVVGPRPAPTVARSRLAVQQLARLLVDAGHECYLVGGSVRDAPSTAPREDERVDVDVTTDASRRGRTPRPLLGRSRLAAGQAVRHRGRVAGRRGDRDHHVLPRRTGRRAASPRSPTPTTSAPTCRAATSP